MNHKLKAKPRDTAGKSDQLYRMLLDAIPSSVLLIDEHLRITSANHNFLEKSQRTMADTIGRRLAAVFPPIILEHSDIEEQIRAGLREKKAVRGQRMTYRAPGIPIRTYYYRILPIISEDAATHVMLLMDDITEQVRLGEEVRRMERHLYSVVESASDIILSTDIEGYIQTWNNAAEVLSGLESQKVLGQHLSGIFHNNKNFSDKDVFRTVINRKQTREAELDLKTNDSGSISVSWIFSPMLGDNGKAIGIVAVGRDRTEQHKLETQLLQSQKLVALGVMAGGIAHEIRNPLGVCSSAAQFLMDDNLDMELRRECAHKIETNIQKASSIIENLLRFARPSSKGSMIEVDIHATLSEAINLISNQAKIQKIGVTADLGARHLRVRGVANLLEQVFTNLFLNAINAMPDGGEISVTLQADRSEAVMTCVDTGVGILKKNIDNVFDPFYTASVSGKGTGLGLSLCYSIIKQHMGTITVKSQENKGSTFVIRLPLL